MEIIGVNRILSAPVTEAPEIRPEKLAEHRPIVQAVKALNGTQMFGHDNQLTFQEDPASKRMVVQVINQKTHELVLQIPEEYVLRIAEDLKQQEDSKTKFRIG